MGVMHAGATVEVVDEKLGWMKVVLDGGQYGYIYKSFLVPTGG
jgi:SH3-like domain-containing protein